MRPSWCCSTKSRIVWTPSICWRLWLRRQRRIDSAERLPRGVADRGRVKSTLSPPKQPRRVRRVRLLVEEGNHLGRPITLSFEDLKI